MVRPVRPHDKLAHISQAMDDAREILFIRYVHNLTDGDEERLVYLRDLGGALHIPFDDAMRMLGELVEDGYIERTGYSGDPAGPALRLTAAGRQAAMEAQ